jgi:hypothetical protein
MNFIELIFILSWSGVVVGQCNNKARVRLVNGTRNGEGRLEVFGSSGWSSVCPDGWATRNAGVACEELCGERKYSTSLPSKGRFGPIPSSNKIRIFNTNCVGYEDSLVKCKYDDKEEGTCYEDSAVGLCCHSGCDNRNMFLAPLLRYAASCDYHNYTVTVQYPPAGPDGTVRPFQLWPYNENRECLSQRTGANTTHNWITVNYTGDCEVIDESDKDFVKYSQKVLIKGQTVGPSISRYYQYLLPITCGINRNTNKTVWLDTSSPNGIISNLTTENGNVSIDMVIKVYKDPDFSQELITPVRLPVGTPLFVELSVDKNKLSAGAKILVENCVAIPFLNSNTKEVIINDQKAVDKGSDIFKSPALHKVQFTMETFKITDNKELYLSCSGYLCPSGDKSQRCDNPAANAQHKPGASRTVNPTAPSTSGSISIVSTNYGVNSPNFKRKPIYDSDDLDGLGPNDQVRIGDGGDDEGKCFILRVTDGSIRLYHNPNLKPKQSQFTTKAEDPILNKCKTQI